MASESAVRKLQEDIGALSDQELIDAAFSEFFAFAADELVGPAVRGQLLKDLEEAEAQLKSEAAVAMEGRGRLRGFLLNARLRK